MLCFSRQIIKYTPHANCLLFIDGAKIKNTILNTRQLIDYIRCYVLLNSVRRQTKYTKKQDIFIFQWCQVLRWRYLVQIASFRNQRHNPYDVYVQILDSDRFFQIKATVCNKPSFYASTTCLLTRNLACFSEAVFRRSSLKKVFLKISLFKILVDLQAYLKKLALEKGTPSRVIPGKICELFKNT